MPARIAEGVGLRVNGRVVLLNPPLKKLTGRARYWAERSLKLNFTEGDAADEDTLNRILWHALKGYDTPYPERYAGGKAD